MYPYFRGHHWGVCVRVCVCVCVRHLWQREEGAPIAADFTNLYLEDSLFENETSEVILTVSFSGALQQNICDLQCFYAIYQHLSPQVCVLRLLWYAGTGCVIDIFWSCSQVVCIKWPFPCRWDPPPHWMEALHHPWAQLVAVLGEAGNDSWSNWLLSSYGFTACWWCSRGLITLYHTHAAFYMHYSLTHTHIERTHTHTHTRCFLSIALVQAGHEVELSSPGSYSSWSQSQSTSADGSADSIPHIHWQSSDKAPYLSCSSLQPSSTLFHAVFDLVSFLLSSTPALFCSLWGSCWQSPCLIFSM